MKFPFPEAMPAFIRDEVVRHGGEGLPWEAARVSCHESQNPGWRLGWSDEVLFVYANPHVIGAVGFFWVCDGIALPGDVYSGWAKSQNLLDQLAKAQLYWSQPNLDREHGPTGRRDEQAPLHLSGPEGLAALVELAEKTSHASWVKLGLEHLLPQWQADRDELAELRKAAKPAPEQTLAFDDRAGNSDRVYEQGATPQPSPFDHPETWGCEHCGGEFGNHPKAFEQEPPTIGVDDFEPYDGLANILVAKHNGVKVAVAQEAEGGRNGGWHYGWYPDGPDGAFLRLGRERYLETCAQKVTALLRDQGRGELVP